LSEDLGGGDRQSQGENVYMLEMGEWEASYLGQPFNRAVVSKQKPKLPNVRDEVWRCTKNVLEPTIWAISWIGGVVIIILLKTKCCAAGTQDQAGDKANTFKCRGSDPT
jgi:hypothetical protein